MYNSIMPQYYYKRRSWWKPTVKIAFHFISIGPRKLVRACSSSSRITWKGNLAEWSITWRSFVSIEEAAIFTKGFFLFTSMQFERSMQFHYVHQEQPSVWCRHCSDARIGGKVRPLDTSDRVRYSTIVVFFRANWTVCESWKGFRRRWRTPNHSRFRDESFKQKHQQD